ncbi:MAG: hypothetical protein CMH70_08505 [Nitrosomonadaceae bacterium]|nr:hypothetical protein [Nitrosomonadaceae bacterium]|tara:strand:+ start:1791 stop:2480 length:690 start_codon:yes stop_codon:yes gene_type:complete
MLDFISSIVIFLAALTFIAGASSWRREFIGKRRIELAESVLAKFYEAEDVIKQIRSPISCLSEGNTRKQEEKELKEESLLLDRAYIVIERYQKKITLFSQIKSMRYQVQSAFGTSAIEPFNELDAIISEIFNASHMLGSNYWPRQGRVKMKPEDFKKHLYEMQKNEEIFWLTDKDTISPRVQKTISKLENILQVAFIPPNDLLTGAVDDIRGYIGIFIGLFKKQDPNNK